MNFCGRKSVIDYIIEANDMLLSQQPSIEGDLRMPVPGLTFQYDSQVSSSSQTPETFDEEQEFIPDIFDILDKAEIEDESQTRLADGFSKSSI